MYNSNGPPRGFNVTQDQSSYDLVFKDIIINFTGWIFILVRKPLSVGDRIEIWNKEIDGGEKGKNIRKHMEKVFN